MTASRDCGGKLAIKELWQLTETPGETPHKGMDVSCRQLSERMVDQ